MKRSGIGELVRSISCKFPDTVSYNDAISASGLTFAVAPDVDTPWGALHQVCSLEWMLFLVFVVTLIAFVIVRAVGLSRAGPKTTK